MNCPLCGFQMTPLDKECPRCHGKGVAATTAPAGPSVAPAQVAPTSAQAQTFHAFTDSSAKRQSGLVACWVVAALFACLGVWFMLRENVILALAFIVFALFPPVFFKASVHQAQSGQIADTLKAATAAPVYVGSNGQGISVDSRARVLVVSREQQGGFLVRRLPVENLTLQLQHGASTEVVGRSFSGTGCAAAGCLLGPLGAILGGMALGNPKTQENHSYRLRILTKDAEYPEHTVDFGADRDRAERFEATIKALI